MCMYVYISKQACKTRGVRGDAPPRKFLEIRFSEIASGAIFGQKQSPLVATILSNFWLSYIHAFAKPADFKFP